jgi:hypothetical protein
MVTAQSIAESRLGRGAYAPDGRDWPEAAGCDPLLSGNPLVRVVAVSRRPRNAARLAARMRALFPRQRHGSPFHFSTPTSTASHPKKNPRLLNGCSKDLMNGAAASHTAIQTATVTQPRQPRGGL